MSQEIPEFLRAKSDRAVRRELRSIMDSYHHFWDILAELIQNSRDAISRRIREQAAAEIESPKGQIDITIDGTNRSITVVDNGTGIDPGFVSDVLSPGGGDKDPDDVELGEKGVGLTFVAFSGNLFELETSHNGEACVATLVGASHWLSNAENPPFPSFEISTSPDDRTPFTKVTVASIPQTQDRDLFALSIGDLKWLLRTRTAVGDTRGLLRMEELPDIDVNYSFTGTDGETFQGTIEASHPDYAEGLASVTIEEVKSLFLKQSKPETRRRLLRNKAITGRYSADDVRVFGVMLPGNRTFDDIASANLITKASEADDTLVRSGIFVSTKSMPTGIEIPPGPGGAYPAYYKRCFFLVESDHIAFDLGRKSMHWRARNKLQSAVSELFSEFEQVAKYQGDPPAVEATASETSAERKHRINKEWEEIKGRHDLGWPGITFSKFPTNQEAAVAALFHELVGSGVISGLVPLATGYSSQYDLHAFYTGGGDEVPVVIEFKSRLESIVSDFRDGVKSQGDVDLLVCWEVDESKLAQVGLSLTPIHKDAPYDGVTDELHLPSELSTETIPVIVLKTLRDRQIGKHGEA